MPSVNLSPINLTVTSATRSVDAHTTITAGDSDAYPLSITFSDLTAITGTVRFRFVRGDAYWDRDATIDGNTVSLTLEPDFYAAPGTELWVSFEDSNLYTPLHVCFRDIRVPSGNVEAATSQPYPSWAADMRELDFAIGTVETLEPGADATASITGDIPDKVLNLGIPKGNTGATGPQGEQGIQGIQGPQGDPGLDGSAVPIDDASSAADRVLSAQYIKGQLSAIDTQLAQKANIAQEAWITPTLLGSWTAYQPVGYMKDTLGFVHLKGIIKDGAMPSDIFTLPTGYRPLNNYNNFSVKSSTTVGGCQIRNTGTVRAANGSTGEFCLDGITFRAGA